MTRREGSSGWVVIICIIFDAISFIGLFYWNRLGFLITGCSASATVCGWYSRGCIAVTCIVAVAVTASGAR